MEFLVSETREIALFDEGGEFAFCRLVIHDGYEMVGEAFIELGTQRCGLKKRNGDLLLTLGQAKILSRALDDAIERAQPASNR